MTSDTSSNASSSTSDKNDASASYRTNEKAGRRLPEKSPSHNRSLSSSDTTDESDSDKADSSSKSLLEKILNKNAPAQPAEPAVELVKQPSKDSDFGGSASLEPRERPQTAKQRGDSKQHRSVSSEEGGANRKAAGGERPKTAKHAHSRRPFTAGRSSSTRSDRSSSSRDLDSDTAQEAASSAPSSLASSLRGASNNETASALRTRQALLEHRASYLRELLLHRYLDYRHLQTLSKHGAHFERHSRQPTSLDLPPSGRHYPAARQRRRYDKSRAIYNTNLTGRHNSIKFSAQREAEVQRAIQSLTEDLLTFSPRDLLIESTRSEIRPKSAMGNRPKSARKLVEHRDSSTEDETVKQVDKKQQSSSAKRVTVVTPTEDAIRADRSRTGEKVSKTRSKNGVGQQEEAMLPRHTKEPTSKLPDARHRRKYGSAVAPGVYTKDTEDQRNSQLDYYFFPNLPGEVFSYSYLAALLSTLRYDPTEALPGRETVSRAMLRHAPVRPSAASRRRRHNALSPSRRSRKLKSAEKGEEDNGKSKDKLNCKIQQENAENGKSTPQTVRTRIGPQVRPGTEPIKCNWKPSQQEKEKPVPKKSDHLLKHTENPTIAEWLRQKNEQARKQRLYKNRQNKQKRERLIEEHNEKEDKRELALVEYEKWKKRKNREILLRRRKEIAESNGSNKVHENVLRSGTVTAQSVDPRNKEVSMTFADLRSSAAASAHVENSAKAKRRPKSAPTKVTFSHTATKSIREVSTKDNFVPVRIDLESGDVQLLSPKSETKNGKLSAREPLVGNVSPSEKKTNNFLENFLDVTSPKPAADGQPLDNLRLETDKSTKDNTRGKSKKDTENHTSRDSYNRWVRTKHSDGNVASTFKLNAKLSPKKKDKSHPKHDPMADSLIPELAKRRIQRILDQKREVDTGLGKNRPRSAAPSSLTKDRKTFANVRQWKLPENFPADREQNNAKTVGSRNSNRQVDDAAAKEGDHCDRPVFSYNPKTKSKSVFFERNPVVRRALDSSPRN